MNQTWNRIIYKMWSPFYDHFFNSGAFFRARKAVFSDQSFEKGNTVLLAGCGTGADLDFLPVKELDITAVDFSADMLQKAREKYPSSGVSFMQMDATSMSLPTEAFDVVIASLLLSVVPAPDKCLAEMIRVAKPNGRIIIFDKFVPKHQTLSLLKKAARPLISVMGTDIGVSFEQLARPLEDQHVIVTDTPLMFNGMYRKIILVKK